MSKKNLLPLSRMTEINLSIFSQELLFFVKTQLPFHAATALQTHTVDTDRGGIVY